MRRGTMLKETGENAKDIYVRQSFLRFWPGRWSFFDFMCWQFLFLMTRATTLPQRVNRNSERFARYEPEKMITFLRKWYRGPKSLAAHKQKSAWLWEKLGDTGLFLVFYHVVVSVYGYFLSCCTVLLITFEFFLEGMTTKMIRKLWKIF